MNKQSKALSYFRNKYNCSQAVFTVFGTEYGLTEDQCLKVACGFGAGIGKQQLTCGALSGAVMALGLKHGKGSQDPEEKKASTYSKAAELFSEFTALNGSACCKELLNGLNMNDPADYEKMVELKLFDTKCEKFVSDAVAIVEKLTR